MGSLALDERGKQKLFEAVEVRTPIRMRPERDLRGGSGQAPDHKVGKRLQGEADEHPADQSSVRTVKAIQVFSKPLVEHFGHLLGRAPALNGDEVGFEHSPFRVSEMTSVGGTPATD